MRVAVAVVSAATEMSASRRNKRCGMKKLWYVSVASASTAAAPRGMGDLERLTPNVTVALLAAGLGCAGAPRFSPTSGSEAATAAPAHVERPGARDANLAGARCAQGPGEPCACRDRRGDPAEKPAPGRGAQALRDPTVGGGGKRHPGLPDARAFRGRDIESCFYIDVVPGTTSDIVFNAKESWPQKGMGPALEISEYGPKGPWWYRILDVHCAGPGGRCNRDAADAWGEEIKTRKRGRIDPCGSTVISRLGWDTSGGAGDPELGLFRDFTVSFTMEIKRFATQFRPGATECVPK